MAKKKNTNTTTANKQAGYDMNFSSIDNLFITAKSSSVSKSFTQDDIETYLGDPYNNTDKLRSLSDYFYFNNGNYRNIVNTFSNIATLDNVILPTKQTLDKADDKAYQTYYSKINAYAESINVKSTTRRILKSVARFGGFVGYERSNGKEFYIQSLPIDWCRVKFQVGSEFQIEFNFKYFDRFWNTDDLELAWQVYPPEFKKLYNRYKKDTKSREPEWQMIDLKKTWCILYDDDEPFFIPPFSGMFNSIMNNEDIKALTMIGKTLDVAKLVVQKIPVNKDGKIQAPKDQVQVFHNYLKKILPEGATAITTPFEISDVPFKNSNQEKEDLLEKSERAIFLDSGMSSALFADNGGNIALSTNLEIVTANIYSILEKVESLINVKFNYVANSKNYTFKLNFFRTTNVNQDKNFERQFQLVSIGGAITPLISISGFDPDAYNTMLEIENNLGIKDLLIPPQSMHTTNGATTSGQGANQKDETTLTDSGVKSRNNEDNNPANRV